MQVNDANRVPLVNVAANGVKKEETVVAEKAAVATDTVTISEEARIAAMSNPGDWPEPPEPDRDGK